MYPVVVNAISGILIVLCQEKILFARDMMQGDDSRGQCGFQIFVKLNSLIICNVSISLFSSY